MNISEKVAYIKGLAEGLNVDDKVVNAILDVLADIAKAVNGLKEDTEYLENYIEEVDEDLGALEEDFYEIDEDECDCCDCDDEWDDEDWDDEDECCCGHDHDDEDLFDGGIYEITCPKCGEIVCMDEEMLFSPDCGCPNCGTSFEIDFDGVECCDDDDCCCGHDHDEE